MKYVPQSVIDDLQSLQKEFIWDCKTAKIKHSTLIGNYEERGLKDVDLPSELTSIKVIWLRKMLNESNIHPRIAVANKILKELGGIKIFHTNLLLAPKNPEIIIFIEYLPSIGN